MRKTTTDTKYDEKTPLTELQKEILNAIEAHAEDKPLHVLVNVPRRIARKTDLSRRIVQHPSTVLPKTMSGLTDVPRFTVNYINSLYPESIRDISTNVNIMELTE